MQFLASFLSLCLLFSLLCVSPITSETYCPSTHDLYPQYGDVNLGVDTGFAHSKDISLWGWKPPFFRLHNGWTINGSGRVVTNNMWNLIGGAISFDMDLSQVAPGFNANLYLIAPQGTWDTSQYCDASGHNAPLCQETDFVETNGNCGGQTAYHDLSGGDDTPILFQFTHTGLVHFDIHFAADGTSFTIKGTQGGSYFINKRVPISPSSISNAVIASSLWSGWTPPVSCQVNAAAAAGSVYTLSNLQVYGQVVSGPVPSSC